MNKRKDFKNPGRGAASSLWNARVPAALGVIRPGFISRRWAGAQC